MTSDPMTALQPSPDQPDQQPALPEIELESGVLEDARLLGTSKAGTTSWRGRIGRQSVRLYRCASSSQAELLAWVSAHPRLGAHFPNCVERQGALLVVEWVDGSTLEKRSYRRQAPLIEVTAELLAHLHGTEPPAGLAVEDVYRTYLIQRWRHHADDLPSQELGERLMERLEAGTRAPRVLTHPDLAPQNLVLDDGGVLRSIDNELMAAGPLPAIDLFNPWRYFGRGLAGGRNLKRYLTAYQAAGGELASLASQADAVQALWHLRRIGSWLEDGRLAEAESLARQVLEGRAADHPLVVAARRLGG